MNVNQKIEAALSEIVDERIWPLSCPLEEKPDEYIVYLPEEDYSADFGNDEEHAWMHRMEVNWYKKGSTKTKAVNYMGARKQIRGALKNAGFSVSNILYFFETDTGYTHLTFICSIQEDDPYGEV